MRWDSQHLAPWRLWVLLRYGEGPHISSLALLPFALAFAWLALERRRPASLAAAAVCSALVALTNFYGATALAIFYPILVWSLWVTHRDNRMWLRAAAIPALAYGLSAFWLTPSYLRITIENLRYVSSPGNAWSWRCCCLAAAAFLLFRCAARLAKPDRAYAVFVSGGLLFMGLNVLGHFYFNFRVIGEPHRLVPELDLAMILAGVELLRRLWNWPARAVAGAAGARAGGAGAVWSLAGAPLRAPRLGSLSAGIGLPAARRIPHVRLDGRASSASAHHGGRVRALLVGHLARPGPGGRRIRTGTPQSKVVPAQWEIPWDPIPNWRSAG
jgi:multidrug transporter EmrE-like cation transporter